MPKKVKAKPKPVKRKAPKPRKDANQAAFDLVRLIASK